MKIAIAALMAGAVLTIVSDVSAADRTIVILDASGSMWGQIDGRPKLEIARETLATVLPTVPPATELGFMTYGHRRKGDCTDIELLVPPAPGSAAGIADAAANLRFLGKTPLSAAVRQAAEALRHTEDKATVVLVTDGVETCEADPCALADELERTGVDFTAHVVGFGLSREEGRQVACLAERTGGRYIDAANAKDLSEALTTTVAEAPPATPTPDKAAAVELPPASINGPKSGVIGAAMDVAFEGPGGKSDYIDIVPAGQNTIGKESAYAWADKGSPVSIRAPGTPGEYQIRYVWIGPDSAHVLATDSLTVADTPVAIVAPASVSAGSDFAFDWKGPDENGDYVDIVPKGQDSIGGELAYHYTARGNPGAMRAPADAGPHVMRYVLAAPDGLKVLAETPIEVTEARATLAFPPQARVGEAISVAWTGPKGDGHYVDLVPDGYTDVSGELTYAYVARSEDGETLELQAPGRAGAYRVRYLLETYGQRRVLADQPLEVLASDATLSAPDAVAAGADITVEWTGPGAVRDYIDVVEAGRAEPEGEVAYAYVGNSEPAGDERKRLTFSAPAQPGSYDLRYVLDAPGGKVILARRPLVVE